MAAPKGVYSIRSKIKPGRQYIGSSANIPRRWRMHISELRRGIHHSKILQNHVNKYGLDDLSFSIDLICDANSLLFYEQALMDFYAPFFNVRKMADSNRGIVRSVETKRKLREINLGKKLSDTTKRKMSARMLGNGYTLGVVPVNARKVIDRLSGTVYESVRHAAVAAGVKQRTLKAWLDGQNKNRSSMEFM